MTPQILVIIGLGNGLRLDWALIRSKLLLKPIFCRTTININILEKTPTNHPWALACHIFIFCILTYAIVYVLIHHITFRLYFYFLNNVLYFFKYSCTNIFHGRSLYTLYWKNEMDYLSYWLSTMSGDLFSCMYNWKTVPVYGRSAILFQM